MNNELMKLKDELMESNKFREEMKKEKEKLEKELNELKEMKEEKEEKEVYNENADELNKLRKELSEVKSKYNDLRKREMKRRDSINGINRILKSEIIGASEIEYNDNLIINRDIAYDESGVNDDYDNYEDNSNSKKVLSVEFSDCLNIDDRDYIKEECYLSPIRKFINENRNNYNENGSINDDSFVTIDCSSDDKEYLTPVRRFINENQSNNIDDEMNQSFDSYRTVSSFDDDKNEKEILIEIMKENSVLKQELEMLKSKAKNNTVIEYNKLEMINNEPELSIKNSQLMILDDESTVLSDRCDVSDDLNYQNKLINQLTEMYENDVGDQSLTVLQFNTLSVKFDNVDDVLNEQDEKISNLEDAMENMVKSNEERYRLLYNLYTTLMVENENNKLMINNTNDKMKFIADSIVELKSLLSLTTPCITSESEDKEVVSLLLESTNELNMKISSFIDSIVDCLNN